MEAAERAARNYVAAWLEEDPEARARLLEACWADDGRMVSRGGAIARGRDALATLIARFHADPRGLRVRLIGTVDAQGPIARFRGVVEDRDGNSLGEALDTIEVDGDGRIVVLLTFAGPF